MKKIGLALGGGGAKGFAHIPILEALDELGVKPCCITGTSVGAIMGALYSAGHSGREIHEMIERLLVAPRKAKFKDLFRNPETFRFMELIDPHFGLKPKGLLKGEKLLAFLFEEMQVETFKELQIPLKVVATDFWRKEQVVLSKGELLPAVRASMALPYIFSPVQQEDRVLVDGGLVNNVPHDLLSKKCDIRIAVDLMGRKTEKADKIPNPMEAVFHTYEVMMNATAQAKREHHPVDIYLEAPLQDVDILDFHKAEEIYEQGLQAKDDFKQQLQELLGEKETLHEALQGLFMNPVWLIIDGYNVLHQADHALAMLETDIGTARHRLVRLVEQTALDLADQATIVFDGREAGPDDALSDGRLEVCYSPGHLSADTVIERLVTHYSHPEKILVVTSDHAEHDTVSGAGAQVMSSEEFLARCERDARRSRSRRTPPGQEPRLGDLFPDSL